MNPEQLCKAIEKCNPDEYPNLIQNEQLILESLERLKEYSARFYFSEPLKSEQIARHLFNLSLHMSPPAPAFGRWSLANALTFLDQYTEAVKFYEQSYADYQADGRQLDAARVGVGYIFALAYTGQSKRAISLSAEIEPILTTSSKNDDADLQRLGNLMMNLGVAYELRNQFEDALTIYERQTEIAKRLADTLMLAQVNQNQAYALERINAYDEALQFYEESIALFAQVEADFDLAVAHMNHSGLLVQIGQYSRAQDSQQEAMKLLSKLEGTEQQWHSLTLLRAQTRLASLAPLDQSILDALDDARVAFKQHGPPAEEGASLILLGHCYLKREELDSAKHAFSRALQIADDLSDNLIEFHALNGLGQLKEHQKELQQAIDIYEQAIERAESLRHGLQIEKFRADFFTDKIGVYQNLVRLYLRLGQLQSAYTTIERSKSRLITEKLFFRFNAEVNSLNTEPDLELRNFGQRLTLALSDIEQLRQLAQIEAFQNDVADGKEIVDSDTVQKIFALEQDIRSITRQIQQINPRFSAFQMDEITATSKLKDHLHEGILVHYYLIHDDIWFVLIDELGIQSHGQIGSVREVEREQLLFRKSISRILDLAIQFGPARAHDYLPALLDDVNQHLYRLHQLLFEPLYPSIPSDSHIVISPDGPLYYLPFQALYDGSSYLVEHFRISTIPNATTLNLCMQKQELVPNVLLMGHSDANLSSIANEIDSLASLLPNAKVLLDNQASTSNFLENAPTSAIIHLASHAQFIARNPMLSSFSLVDRALPLVEIVQLSLHAELAVLSGCDTGNGSLWGNDMISLASGFLGAGVQSLLVNLWPAEDKASTQLIVDFYQRLKCGESKAEALSNAQSSFLERARQADGWQQLYEHPAFWAPLSLIGDWRPLRADLWQLTQ